MNVRDFNSSLSRDILLQRAPSIFADKPADKVSEHYQFVPTVKVLEVMESEGFIPIFASQQKVRNADNRSTTKHQVMLRKDGIKVTNARVGDTLPTLHVVNSHDWSSRFEVRHAMLRIACSNGLVIESGCFQAYSIRHDTLLEDIQNLISRFMSGVTRLQATIDAWSAIELSMEKALDFAMRAAILRFGDNALPKTSEELLGTRRESDMGRDLWTIYNVVQENIIRGGIHAGRRRSRAIGNIDKGVELNTKLFELASSYS